MQRKLIISGLLLLTLFGTRSGFAAEQVETRPLISGQMVNGLRVLTIGSTAADNHFVVYRGDYIQPILAGAPSFEITIADLNIKKDFPAVAGSKPYIKMTKPGRYRFEAGEQSGWIEVIPYSGSHYTELTADEARAVMKNIEPLVLDVRTPGEYRQGHIGDAMLLPVQELEQQIATLDAYREKEILIYCASGNRSTVASRILNEHGFTKIYNLRYGITDWIQRGFPVE